jgi:D-beta-D-heptose 7-phosphate kinase / D-beta-D-heptose 1-phosphate adenosyltransferase
MSATGKSSSHSAMFNFEDALKLIPEQTIVCLGDLMLDEFVYGEVSRISPEAPAPILAVRRNELTVGGAGNVARNIAALGARCIFLAVVGEDDTSRTLMRALAAEPLIEPHIVVDSRRPTTRKVRFVSEHHATHLLRADWELVEPLESKTEKGLIDRTPAALPRAGSVVLSDYAKGTLTPRVIRTVIDAANASGIPVIVDPKAADYSIYRGATVVKPNRKEARGSHAPPRRFRCRRSRGGSGIERGAGDGGGRGLAQRRRPDASTGKGRGDPRTRLSGQGGGHLRRRRHRGRRARRAAGDQGRL